MDVVYINRPGEENEELRYSLRSLANLAHDRVWIVGYCPGWLQGVERVPVESMRDKQTSALTNLITAINHPEISDPFVIFNDDFYVMQPMREIPTLHMGELDKVISEHRQGSAYRNAMEKTRDRIRADGNESELYCYELHAPMVIEKLGMQLALSIGQGIYGMHNRTMYGNLMGVGGTETHDFKVYRTEKSKDYESWPFLSTSDRTFAYHPAGKTYIRAMFPDPSPYEKPIARRRAIRHTTVVVHPSP